jgi:hypothetical protein
MPLNSTKIYIIIFVALYGYSGLQELCELVFLELFFI